MNWKSLEFHLDLFDYIAVLFTEEDKHKCTIYKRSLKAYDVVEEHELENISHLKTSIKLFNSDQKIPLFHHVNSNQIKERMVHLSDVDSDDLEEELNKLKPSLFTVNRLKQGRVFHEIIHKNDSDLQVKLTYVPDRLMQVYELNNPFIYVLTTYNGFKLQSDYELTVLKKADVFYLSFNTEEASYSSALIQSGSEIDTINRLISGLQADVKVTLPEFIYFDGVDDIPKIDRFKPTEKPISYIESFLSSISLKGKSTEGVSYFVKQRVLKSILWYGVIFIVFFMFGKVVEGISSLGTNYYSSEISSLSKELYHIDLLEQEVTDKKRQFDEVNKLSANRSYFSHKVQTISKFFNRYVWLKKVESTSPDAFLLHGFALKAKDLDKLLASLREVRGLTVKPVLQEQIGVKELKREKLTRYNSLVRFQLEVNY